MLLVVDVGVLWVLLHALGATELTTNGRLTTGLPDPANRSRGRHGVLVVCVCIQGLGFRMDLGFGCGSSVV